MAVAVIGPKFYGWDVDGLPLVGGKLYTYEVQTNIPKDTYKSENQLVANTNPVILNAEGYADVYLSGSYKFVLKDSDDNEIWTSDPVTNNTASEWLSDITATYISPSSFSIVGNQVSLFNEGRKIRLQQNSGNVFGVIETAIYSAPNTIITASVDEALDPSLDIIQAFIIDYESGQVVYSASDLSNIKAYKNGQQVELSDGGRSGLFIWDSSDLSTEAATDPENGVYVPYLSGTGSGGAWVRQIGEYLTSVMFGITDDTNDKTSIIEKFIEFNHVKKKFISQDYFIEGTGPDSGGVSAVISRDTYILCEEGVRFYTDALDNDMIRITADQSLSAAIESVTWIGGKFDQSDQKNSTVIPFSGDYPPANPGSSATCDGLSFKLLISSDTEAGANILLITGVETNAGDHWEIAGGDSGIFASGAIQMLITDNICIGNRDLGVYASASQNADIDSSVTICKNTFKNCFHGAAGKRIIRNLEIYQNTATNCVRAYLCEQVSGFAVIKCTIKDNAALECLVTVKVDACDDATIKNNYAFNSGALLADGVSIITALEFNFIDVLNTENTMVRNNKALGQKAVYNTASLGTAFEIDGTIDCSVVDNIVDGWRNLGREVNTPDGTVFVNNKPRNIINIGNIQSAGTNLREIRVQSNNALLVQTKIQHKSTDATDPILTKRDEDGVGIFFSLNTVGLASNGVAGIAVNADGVGFNDSTPIVKPDITGSRGGNAALASILTALVSYGLITDSTT
jgi:hypothetical protein